MVYMVSQRESFIFSIILPCSLCKLSDNQCLGNTYMMVRGRLIKLCGCCSIGSLIKDEYRQEVF